MSGYFDSTAFDGLPDNVENAMDGLQIASYEGLAPVFFVPQSMWNRLKYYSSIQGHDT
jgi:hypothetical protein